MRRVFQRLSGYERTDRSVLIQGERGSGRRFVAREIHSRSLRQGGPFVAYDCRGQEVLDVRRTLLGQIRELAPGHYLKYLGILEEVRDGTLYLEGIDALSPEVQEELASVLDDGNFTPIGSDQDVSFRGRVIASSSEDLADRVADGEFAGELYRAITRDGICVKLQEQCP